MALTLTGEQHATLGPLRFLSKKGNPATVEGIPTWESSDPTVATVTPSADGMTALLETPGPAGTARITATADADRGEGVRPITGILDVTVLEPEAETVEIPTGTPEDDA